MGLPAAPFALAVAATLLACGTAARADALQDAMRDARRLVAERWQKDARLVSVQVTGYGWDAEASVTARRLIPDNIPKIALLTFFAPTAGDDTVLLVMQQLAEPREPGVVRLRPPTSIETEPQLTEQHRMLPLEAEIPADVMTLTEAVALARASGLEEDCAGTNPQWGCDNVTGADLHVYIVGAGEQVPIWRINFAQDGRGREIVRLINARSRRLIVNCVVPSAGQPQALGNIYLECRG